MQGTFLALALAHVTCSVAVAVQPHLVSRDIEAGIFPDPLDLTKYLLPTARSHKAHPHHAHAKHRAASRHAMRSGGPATLI